MQRPNSSPTAPSKEPSALEGQYAGVRAASATLAAPLSDGDATAQSMPDASPAKWHLAHTSWFFEAMVLQPHLPGYGLFDEKFNFLFNSYYESVGPRQPRALRGLLTRPSLMEVLAYREHVDSAMARLLKQNVSEPVLKLIELGCHHEQQHQELLLTDILHLFAQNPLRPAYKESEPLPVELRNTGARTYQNFPSDTRGRGLASIARARGTRCMSTPTASPIDWSPTASGFNSWPTAGIAIRCCGYPTAGREPETRRGPHLCIGKRATESFGP
jgi:hypothetical protein